MISQEEIDLVRIFHRCNSGMMWQWPDGRAFLDQPTKLAEAMDQIGAELARSRKGATEP